MTKITLNNGVLQSSPATLLEALNPMVVAGDIETGIVRLIAVATIVTLLRG